MMMMIMMMKRVVIGDNKEGDGTKSSGFDLGDGRLRLSDDAVTLES